MLTDPIADLHAALCQRPALIVHFSGVPKGVGHNISYPDDLIYVLENPLEILCCSAVEPGDVAHDPPRATGSVGIVIDPLAEDSIVYVNHEDLGSPPETAKRRTWDRATSVKDCVRSFRRDGYSYYNEWLVGPYRIVGLFVAQGAQVDKKNDPYCEISINEILSDLGQHRVFSCLNDQFVEWVDAEWQTIDMNSVYH